MWFVLKMPGASAAARAVFALALAFVVGAHAESAPKKLLVVGDSLSSGYGLRSGEGWVNLLAQSLDGIEIINDSISGDTTAGGASRMATSLKRDRPDWVIIELGGNDGLRGGSLVTMKANLVKMIEIARAHEVTPVLLGMRMPPNYGEKYTRGFAEVYTQIAAEREVPLLPFFLSGIEDSQEMFQPDGIHPVAEAQPLIERNVREFLQMLW